MSFKLAMRSESWVDRQLHDRKGRFRERIGKPKMSKEKSKVLRRAWQGESKEKRFCLTILGDTGSDRLGTLHG